MVMEFEAEDEGLIELERLRPLASWVPKTYLLTKITCII